MAAIFKNGNTALITGGASGIGLALAKKCHGHGMRVAIVDRNTENLARAAKDLPGAKTFDVDVGDIKAWQRLKGDIEGSFGTSIFISLGDGDVVLFVCVDEHHGAQLEVEGELVTESR